MKKITAALALMICFAAGTSTATAETADTEDYDVVKSVADRSLEIDRYSPVTPAYENYLVDELVFEDDMVGLEYYKWIGGLSDEIEQEQRNRNMPFCYKKGTICRLTDLSLRQKIIDWYDTFDRDEIADLDDHADGSEPELFLCFKRNDRTVMLEVNSKTAVRIDEFDETGNPLSSEVYHIDKDSVLAEVRRSMSEFIDACDEKLASQIGKGDIDFDARVNVTDLERLAAHIKGKQEIYPVAYKAADVNNDGAVNIADLSVLAYNVKGMEKEIPLWEQTAE